LEYFVIWSENTLWATILINLFLQLAVKFSTKLLWRMMAIL